MDSEQIFQQTNRASRQNIELQAIDFKMCHEHQEA